MKEGFMLEKTNMPRLSKHLRNRSQLGKQLLLYSFAEAHRIRLKIAFRMLGMTIRVRLKWKQRIRRQLRKTIFS